MELVGLIVRALPRHLQSVKSALLSVPGLEIHHTDPDGRMIVTIELNSHKALSNSISLLQSLDKVLAVSLVYQHSEVLEDTDSEVSHDSPPQPSQHITQSLSQQQIKRDS
jgi:nitrate reductase NapD